MENEKEVTSDIVVLTGSSNPELAGKVAKRLWTKAYPVISRFADNEVDADIPISVRGKKVFIIQSTVPPLVDSHYFELFAMIDAAQSHSAESVHVVMPYYGYARQDKPDDRRSAVMGMLITDIFKLLEVNHVITVDIHSEALAGAKRRLPWDNLSARKYLLKAVAAEGVKDILMTSPDDGGVKRTTKYSRTSGNSDEMALLAKYRNSKVKDETKVTNLIGDVEDRNCLLVDDIISTAGTLANGADFLMERGAKSVRGAATHAVFSGNALEKIENSALEKVFITDSLPVREEVRNHPKIKVVSIAELLGDAILSHLNKDTLVGEK